MTPAEADPNSQFFYSCASHLPEGEAYRQVLHKAMGAEAPLPLEGPSVLNCVAVCFLKSTFSLGKRTRRSVTMKAASEQLLKL